MTSVSQPPTRAGLGWRTSRERVRNEYDALRSHYVFGALDAVVTAELTPFYPRADQPVIRRGPRGYRRAQRLASLVAHLVPRGFALGRRCLLRPSYLPFAADSVRLLSYGSGATVFLVSHAGLNGDRREWVVKVERASLGRRLDKLCELARRRRGTYRTVSSWYEGCSVLLPTHVVVLHGPLLSRRAVAQVQPYVSGRRLDVFSDLSESDLVRLLKRHERLRDQFKRFVERTLRAADEGVWCLDLLGPDNLTLTGEGEALRLTLLEHGVFWLQQAEPDAIRQIRVRLAYLERVGGQL